MKRSSLSNVNIHKGFLLTGCSAMAMFASTAALAADEIIVSATKRQESIQEVPLAISAYSGEFVRETNLDDVKDLVKFTPGVSGNSFDSFIDFINVRGIRTNDFGVGGDPSIPLFKNGLYQSRNGAAVSSLFDIDHAEVLRGPQGFLFGRNAIGGAISVQTAKPRIGETSGYVELDVAERSRLFGEGALNIPVSDNFAVRFAVYGGHEDGYVNNVARPGIEPQIEPEKYAGRFSALYSNDKFEALFTAEYENRKQTGSLYRATEMGDQWDTLVDIFGVSLGGSGRDIDSDQTLGEADDAKIWSLGLQLDFDLGGATLTSLTGYKDHEYFYSEDFDGTPLRINDYQQDQEGRYFEQEVRVVSDTDGPLSWYAGASYYNEEIDVLFTQGASEEVMCQYYLSYYGFNSCSDYFAYYYYAFTADPNGLIESNAVRGRYHGWGAYVDATWKISDQFDVGVGVRYSKDTKDFGIMGLPVTSQLGPYFGLGFTSSEFIQAKQSWDAFTPRFIARYHPTDDWMIFASATRGFKAGGFGSFSILPDNITYCGPFSTDCLNLTNADASPDPFDPEKAWSYEVGMKGNLGGFARVDANVYYYTYKDLQQTVTGAGGGIVVENIGDVKGWGFEGSIDADLGEYFGLLVSGGYIGTEANQVQAICDDTDACEGSSLAQVPKWAGAAILTMDIPLGQGAVHGSAEFTAQTKTFGGAMHLAEAVNPGYHDLAFRLGYKADAGWSVIGYVENATDEVYFSGAEESGALIPAHFIGPSRPRTFGVIMSYEFGG
ncbi:TonB-dependent receptor [Hyphococcus sp.]|uniref:TonB-dependent receptor n=1 Tax=Hyphococcus sp. TaxID=2038636 RepID=UPI00207EBD7B|nr:MAG: TonB-dependent receptor [Marinicaulis sp.]